MHCLEWRRAAGGEILEGGTKLISSKISTDETLGHRLPVAFSCCCNAYRTGYRLQHVVRSTYDHKVQDGEKG